MCRPITRPAFTPISADDSFALVRRDTTQALVAYTAQAPMAYTAQVPSTYTLTAGAAPVGNTTTGAAPTIGNSPGAAGVRISNAVRNALYADLVAYYHSR